MSAKTAYHVRPTGSSDEVAVSALLELSYAALMPAGYEPALLARLLPIIGKANPTLLASGTYYAALSDEGHIVGVGGWTQHRPGDGGQVASTGHIRHFASHPDWIGQGVGRAIFDHCLAGARAVGLQRFECYASLNAVDFYRKLGFKAIGRVDIPIGSGLAAGDDLVMPAKLMERLL